MLRIEKFEIDVATRKTALVVAVISSLLTPFMISSVNIALPSITHEFSMDAVMQNWVLMSYLLSSAMFLVPLGKLADMFGRKKVFTIGIIVFTASSLFLGFSASLFQFILLRLAQGIGGAMIWSTGVAIASSVFLPGERGKALGIVSAATYLGLSLGPSLGGILINKFGWRSIFLFNVPLGIITIILVFLRLKREWAETRKRKFDFTGSVFYGLALLTIVYGLSLVPSIYGLFHITFGCACIMVFAFWENHVKNPVLDVSIFRENTIFTFSNIAALINYSATFAVPALLSQSLQYLKGLGPQEVGLILVTQPIIQTVVSPLAGWLSDRIEPRVIASIGMALLTIGLCLLVPISGAVPLEFIVSCLVIIGFGFAFFISPNTNAVMSSIEEKFYGVASATLMTMRSLGSTLSMGIITATFALHIGEKPISIETLPLFLESVRACLKILSILCFIGLFFSLFRGKSHKRRRLEIDNGILLTSDTCIW